MLDGSYGYQYIWWYLPYNMMVLHVLQCSFMTIGKLRATMPQIGIPSEHSFFSWRKPLEEENLNPNAAVTKKHVSSCSLSLPSLIQDNASVRGRMLYLQQGIAVADEFLEHLLVTKVSFSRQVKSSDSSLLLLNEVARFLEFFQTYFQPRRVVHSRFCYSPCDRPILPTRQ